MINKLINEKILASVGILVLTGAFSVHAKEKTNDPNKIFAKEVSAKQETEKQSVNTVRNFEVPNQVKLQAHSLGVGLGQTFLMGQFADHADDQITLDVLYEYSASYSFDFLLDFHYSKHEFTQTNVSLLGLTSSIKMKAFQFDQFAPYALAGLGFYRPQTTRFITSNSGTRTETAKAKITFGTNLGAGFDLRLNPEVKLGMVFIYHNPFDVKQENAPDVEGSYSKLLITTMYTF